MTNADARGWLADHLREVIGQPAEAARAVVAEAGLRPRILREGAIVTAELRSDRVNLRVDGTERVVAATAG